MRRGGIWQDKGYRLHGAMFNSPAIMNRNPHDDDPRTILTLDAGGTNLKFSAIRGNALLCAPVHVPSEAHDLSRCLANIVRGFREVEARLPGPAAALSFAFPGPADYPAGIIGDQLPNFPAFRAAGGVALGPLLEAEFRRPVFINNDGNLFVYGEAIAGFLPYVNDLLSAAGNPKRYRNLFGITLGTGLGGGIVLDRRLLVGDSSNGGEAHLLRNVLDPSLMAEEGACIRAVRGVYAREAGLASVDAPEPKTIADIAGGHAPGNAVAAREAFRRLGEVAGDAIAQALALIDGVAVIGGGMAAAHPLFLPSLVDAMNRSYARPGGGWQSRLSARACNVEDAAGRAEFTRHQRREIEVPGTGARVGYDPQPRTAVGVSRLGTSEAVAVGAYAYALERLGRG